MKFNFNKRDFYSTLFVAALDNFGVCIVFVIFAPLIFNPAYAIVSPDTSSAMRNLLLAITLSAFPFAQFFGAAILGEYADRVGRKKALLLTLFGTLLGYAFSAISVDLKSVHFLILSRLFTGFFAGNIAICLAILADMTSKDKSRGKAYGNLTIVYGVSAALAIVVGGFLSNPELSSFFNPSIPFWITCFLSLCAFFLIKVFFTETAKVHKPESYRLSQELAKILEAVQIKETRFVYLAILCWSLGWTLAVQWFSAYSIQKFAVSQSAVSVFFLVQGIFWSVGGALLNPILLKKYSVFTTGLVGFVCTACFLFFVMIFDNFFNLATVICLAATVSVLAMNSSFTLLSLLSPEGKQGTAMGLGQSINASGGIIVPFLGGLISLINLDLVYPLCGSFFVLGIAVFLWKRKHFLGSNW
jgi:DHA1 family tetracycline resistance protein-like MFS transporter